MDVAAPWEPLCLLIGAWHNCGHIRSCKRSMVVTGSSSYTRNIQGSHLLSILGCNKNSCFEKKGDMDKISGICMRLEQLFMSRKWRFLGNGSRFDGSCLTLLDAPICRRAGFWTRSRHSKFISFWDGQNFWTLRTKQVDVGLTIFGPEATAIAEFTADFVPFPFIWSKTTQRSSSFSVNLKTIVIFSYISCIYNHNYSKLLLIFWWFSCLAPNLTIHGSFDHQSCHSAQPPSPFGSVPCETNGTEHRIHHSRISNRRLHCNIVATCSNLVFSPRFDNKTTRSE